MAASQSLHSRRAYAAQPTPVLHGPHAGPPWHHGRALAWRPVRNHPPSHGVSALVAGGVLSQALAEHVAVAGFWMAPAAQYLAAQFRQARLETRR